MNWETVSIARPGPPDGSPGGLPHCPGRVDAAVAKARDVDPHVTRNGEHAGCPGDGIHGQQNDRIGTGRAAFPADVPATQTEEDDIDPTPAIPAGHLDFRRCDFGQAVFIRQAFSTEIWRTRQNALLPAAIVGRASGQGSQLPAGGHVLHKEKRAYAQRQGETPEKNASP